MPARLTEADSRIDAVRGCLAIERGPLVYCVEQADLPRDIGLDQIVLAREAGLGEVGRPDLLGGVVAVEAAGIRAGDAPPTGWPYSEAHENRKPLRRAGVPLTAIPYFAWANRGDGAMRVWIPAEEGGDSGT